MTKGPSIKDVHTKSRKIDLLLSCSQNARTGLTPPCPCGHVINFEKSEIFVPKVRTSTTKEPPLVRTIPALDNPSDYEHLLWTASKTK